MVAELETLIITRKQVEELLKNGSILIGEGYYNHTVIVLEENVV